MLIFLFCGSLIRPDWYKFVKSVPSSRHKIHPGRRTTKIRVSGEGVSVQSFSANNGDTLEFIFPFSTRSKLTRPKDLKIFDKREAMPKTMKTLTTVALLLLGGRK
jgi:hypothetical protein